MDSIDLYLKVNKEDIQFICSVMEVYEGMVAIRTPNPEPGLPTSILQVMLSPDFKEEFEIVLQELSRKLKIEVVSA